MSTRALVYPYEVVEGIVLALSNPVEAGSGEALSRVTVQREDEIGQERWDFIDARPPWTGIELDLELSLTAEEIARVLPAHTKVEEEAVGIVSVMCASTNYRRGVRLKPVGDGRWAGTLLLPREDVHGLVELTPSLVRIRDDGDAEDGRFASFAGAVLGTGKAVQLVLDRAARRYDGSMEYVWEDFAQSANTWRKARKDDVFHLEPGETPTLYLNLRWPFLKPLLEFEGRTGAGAAMRDLTAATIAQGAWTQLFATAVASIQASDDDASGEGEGEFVAGEAWRKDLVKLVLTEVYADEPQEERMRLAYAEWRDPATVGPLLAKLGAVAQSRATLGRLMDRAAKAMEAVSVTDEQ